LPHLLERANGALKIVLREAAGDSIGPLDLTARDRVKRRTAARREHRELRSLVGRIVAVGQQPVGLEEVGRPLHALPREPHPATDISDRSRVVVKCPEHLPPCTGLATRTRQRIAGAQKTTIQSKDFENQLGKDLTRGGSVH
jgi:hypothetical protein